MTDFPLHGGRGVRIKIMVLDYHQNFRFPPCLCSNENQKEEYFGLRTERVCCSANTDHVNILQHDTMIVCFRQRQNWNSAASS